MSAALMTSVGLADGAADALDELLLPVDVLRALGPQDLVLDRGDRGALLALDVLLGLDEQAQVREHPVVRFEDDAQLVLARAVHADLIRRVRVLRRDEVDRQLPLGAMGLVVELEAEREVLPVLGVADLVGLDDVAGEDLEQSCADLGGVDVDVLDLFLDDLLFVGQVLVDVAVALDVGLRLQQGQRFLDLLRQGRKVEAEAVVDEHREVARCRLEALDVLDEEERLEEPDRQRGCRGCARRRRSSAERRTSARPGCRRTCGRRSRGGRPRRRRCPWRPAGPRRASTARRPSCCGPRRRCGRRCPRSRLGTAGTGS